VTIIQELLGLTPSVNLAKQCSAHRKDVSTAKNPRSFKLDKDCTHDGKVSRDAGKQGKKEKHVSHRAELHPESANKTS
jgi:hypothetical protein